MGKLKVLSVFFFIFMLVVPTIFAYPIWDSYVTNGTDSYMTNTASAECLLSVNGYVFTPFKSYNNNENLTIQVFRESDGTFLNTISSQDALYGDIYTMRLAPFNHTNVMIRIISLNRTAPYYDMGGNWHNYGNVNCTVWDYLFNGTTLILYGYGKQSNIGWLATWGYDPSSGGGSVKWAYQSNLINNSLSEMMSIITFTTTCPFQVQGTLDSTSSWLVSDISGTISFYKVDESPSNGGAYNDFYWCKSYYGIYVLLDAYDSKIWLLGEGSLMYYNSLSHTNVTINKISRTPPTNIVMTQPTDSWWVQASWDGTSGTLSNAYFGNVITINSTYIQYTICSYFNVSVTVTNRYDSFWNYLTDWWNYHWGDPFYTWSPLLPNSTTYSTSWFNCSSTQMIGQGLIDCATLVSAFRTQFATINPTTSSYDEWAIDFDQYGNIVSKMVMPLSPLPSDVMGGYAIRWCNTNWNPNLNTVVAWSGNFSLGYFVGTPETIIIAENPYRLSPIIFDPVNMTYSELIDNGTANNTMWILQTTINTTNPLDELLNVATYINSTNASINIGVYLTDTNASVSAMNPLRMITSSGITSVYAGEKIISCNLEDNLMGRTLAITFIPATPNAFVNLRLGVPLNSTWWNQKAPDTIYYYNASTLPSSFVPTGVWKTAGSPEGYYFRYGLFTPPSGNQSGTVTGQTGFNWTYYFENINITRVPINITHAPVNDSLTQASQWLADMLGMNITTLGFIVSIVTIIFTAIFLAVTSKGRVPSIIYIAVLFLEIGLFTFINLLPQYVILTIFALVVGIASLGIASLFAGKLSGNSASPTGSDKGDG